VKFSRLEGWGKSLSPAQNRRRDAHLMPIKVMTNPLYPFLSEEDNALVLTFYLFGFTIFVAELLVISGRRW